MSLPSHLQYMLRAPAKQAMQHRIFPAGSVQRQQIERMIERAGGEIEDSYDAIFYTGVDSYTATMLFSEAYHSGWTRRI